MSRVYDKRTWRGPSGLRRRALQRDLYQCRMCGCVSDRCVVDHIRPVSDAPELAMVLSNLQTLCPECHNRLKQQQEVRGYHGQVGVDGWPIDPNHPVNR